MMWGLRQFLFVAILLAVPLASYFLVFKPQNAEIAKAKTEIELKQTMLEKLRAATAQTADLEKANAEIAESIRAIEARLPTNKEVDNVLREVAQIAAKAGLRVPVFRKNDRVQPGGGPAREQALEVEITGNFDGFYAFLLDLERIPRITRLPDLKIVRADKDQSDGTMKANFTLMVYYEGEPVADAAAGGKR